MSRRSGQVAVTRLVIVLMATLVGLGASVFLTVPASAHAVLVSSSPTDGSTVARTPAAVALTFDEAVQPIPASDEVISTTGARVDTGRLSQTGKGATIVLPLRPGLPKGSYTAVWRVVSADTHIVSGSITFGVGVSPSAVPAAQPVDVTGPLDVADDAGQGLVYAGVVLLLGILTAGALWWPWTLPSRRVRLAARAGWALTLLGTLATLLLEGPRADNVSWAGVWRFDDFGQTLSSAFGWELLGRLGLLVVITPLLTRWWIGGLRRRGRVVVSGLAALSLLVTVALTGHESVGADVPLAMTAAVLHLAAMTLWLGGLALLCGVVLPATRGQRQPLITAVSLRRWSVSAYGCVACLVITGEYLASRQLAPVQSLWSTSYGVVLLIKLGVIAVILSAAALAQRRVQALDPAPAPSGAPDRFLHGAAHVVLRRSVRIETALAVLVLGVTAVLVSEPPGNTTYGPPVAVTAPLGPDTIHIKVDSTLHGRQQFDVAVTDLAGRPAPVQSINASLSNAAVASLAMKVSPDSGSAAAGGWSEWRSAPIVVPDPGIWTVDLDVSIDETDAYATTTKYRVW